MAAFTANNWYWFVGTDRTQVYSSASATYVPITDATYLAWAQTGNSPTTVSNQSILFNDIMARLYPQGTPWGKALVSGLAITSSTTPTLNGTYDISLSSQNIITGVAAAINAGLGLPGGGSTFLYGDMSGNPHMWPATQFTAFAKAVMNFIYAVNLASGGAPLPTQPIAID